MGVCETVHIKGARALLVMPHRTFLLPDCLGKAVWRTCSLGGFAFLAGPIESFALRRDVHPSWNRMPWSLTLLPAKWRGRLFVTGVRL